MLVSRSQRSDYPPSWLSRAIAPETVKTHSTAEVSRLAGVSLRQLQWWDEHELFMPEIMPGGRAGEGHNREYSQAQIKTAIQIGQLRKAGVSLQQIRKMLRRPQSWESV